MSLIPKRVEKKTIDVIKTEVVFSDISAGRGQINHLFYIGQSARHSLFIITESQFIDTELLHVKFK